MKRARDGLGNRSGAKELLGYFNKIENLWSGLRDPRYTTKDFGKKKTTYCLPSTFTEQLVWPVFSLGLELTL